LGLQAVASLQARLERLEWRRQQAAIDEIFEKAHAATLDDIARCLMAGFRLEQEGAAEGFCEADVWRCLGIPSEVARVAKQHPGPWCSKLADVLVDKRGLRSFLWEHYPGAARQLYGQRGG
jgi:hypothetical protein